MRNRAWLSPSLSKIVRQKNSYLVVSIFILIFVISYSLTNRNIPHKITHPVWKDSFDSDNWFSNWHIKKGKKNLTNNIEIVSDEKAGFNKVLRINFKKGANSPQLIFKKGMPKQDVDFYATLGIAPQERLHLRYYLKFAENFNFVKGGKLPGIFGGTAVSGDRIPDGTNGFSTRYMWREHGDGEVDAYLPTSKSYGTSFGRGKWKFEPGKWQLLEQEVILNSPGKNNGELRVWFNQKLVLEEKNLYFRSTTDLKIEGIFFSTFFGGHDDSWNSPVDTFIDFANFAVDANYIGP